MRFNPKARLDTSRMRDSGGRRAGGGPSRSGPAMRLPGGAAAGGGGVIAVIALVVFVVLQLTGDGGGTASSVDDGLDTSRVGGDGQRYAACDSGADANESDDCARVAVENSLTSYWAGTLPEQSGTAFRPERVMRTFSGSVQTGCGQATSDVGPFYCPPDQGIYLDTTFFEDVLQRGLGGPAGDFVEPYVLAHEYGHHIQNLMGTMGKVRTQQGPESDAVRLELQADCYAGMWTASATSASDDTGQAFISELDQGDIDEAIAAAQAVGDDRIQDRTTGRVNPAEWTHGSAEQRQRWFTTGYEQGTLEACDTFSASSL